MDGAIKLHFAGNQTDLDSSLRQRGFFGKLLPGLQVRVMALLKLLLQLLELFRGEAGPAASELGPVVVVVVLVVAARLGSSVLSNENVVSVF